MNKNAFTITEIIVTVAILSVIAAFAIPSYQRAIEKGYERDGIANLITIHGALEIYRAQNGSYLVTGGPNFNLNQINTLLNLNIQPGDLTITYTSVTGANYTASAACASPPCAAAWTASIGNGTIDRGNNPVCSAGTCPSL